MQLANQVVKRLEPIENEGVIWRSGEVEDQGKCNSMHIMSSGRR
jgi:hypothetical protein